MNKWQKVLVIGDAMLDKHTRGDVTRLSPEAPVPVINANQPSKITLGAAAHVAAQIAAANIPTFFAFKSHVDPIGSNSTSTLLKMCDDANIFAVPLAFREVRAPVTTKERVWAGSQQVCRIDRECTQKPNRELESDWIATIKELIEREVAIVVFSDYDKGTLTDSLIQSIADFCYERGIITIMDPKRYSFFGLQHLTLVKPNGRELALTNLNAVQCSKELGNTCLLHTRGREGMTLYQAGNKLVHENAQAAPDQVVDVCGCGDTVTAFLAIALHHRQEIHQAIKTANRAAAVNIRYQGCHLLDQEEISMVFSLPGVP